MNFNSRSEIKRAARIFYSSHAQPYEETVKLAESAWKANLPDHFNYWRKVSVEIKKMEKREKLHCL